MSKVCVSPPSDLSNNERKQVVLPQKIVFDGYGKQYDVPAILVSTKPMVIRITNELPVDQLNRPISEQPTAGQIFTSFGKASQALYIRPRENHSKVPASILMPRYRFKYMNDQDQKSVSIEDWLSAVVIQNPDNTNEGMAV
jgi:hypothetical protein